jgi:hypothetical protein
MERPQVGAILFGIVVVFDINEGGDIASGLKTKKESHRTQRQKRLVRLLGFRPPTERRVLTCADIRR